MTPTVSDSMLCRWFDDSGSRPRLCRWCDDSDSKSWPSVIGVMTRTQGRGHGCIWAVIVMKQERRNMTEVPEHDTS
jgi:hypothetical protein